MNWRKISLYLTILTVCTVALSATWRLSNEFKRHLLVQQATSDAIRWANFIAVRSPNIKAELVQGRISKQTRDALELASQAGGVFRFKLFDPNGVIVHASRPGDLGEKNTKPYFNDLVRKGQTFSKIESGEDFGAERSVVSEAYIPLMEEGRFRGAVAVYVDETIKAVRLDHAARFVFWSAVALVMAMALSWAFFIWRDLADRDQALAELEGREAELTHHNQRFDTALANMSQGLCMFDGEQRLIVCNERYASMYGLSPEITKPGTTLRQILDDRIAKGFYGEAGPDEYTKERIAWVTNRNRSAKVQELNDGRYIQITHEPMSDGGWLDTHEDVTELKQADGALREREKAYGRIVAALEQSSDMIVLFDSEDRIVFANRAWRQLNSAVEWATEPGITFEQHLRALTDGGLVPKAIGHEEKWIAERLERHRNPKGPFEVSRQDDKWTLVNEKVLEDGSMISVISDITERKLAVEALQKSEEMFLKAFHANPIPFAISNPTTGAIYDANEAWLTTLGYTREEAISNSALKLGIWADPKKRADFTEMLKETGIVTGYETQYQTKSGELVEMVVWGQHIEVAGEPRMVTLSHDVTESKKAKQQLLEHRDLLQEKVNEATAELNSKAERLEVALAKERELNEMQRQFVSMVSHEFRTPLTIIDGSAYFLARKAENITTDYLLAKAGKIRVAVQRMTRLMESTLTVARMEEGKIAIDIGDCEVGKIIREVCAREQEMAKIHVISCDIASLPATIQADSEALDQMLTNLLSNAVKYAPDASDIEVKGQTIGDDVVITVRDHGLGIDEDDLPKMFTRFFRARTSVGIAGTGIGLYMIKTLAEMHEGSINVESKKGEGSTFTIRLPIVGPTRSEQEQEQEQENASAA